MSASSTEVPSEGPRNIVVLCDGTSNEVLTDLTNVLKLYRIAEHDPQQIVYYQPGVGTVGSDYVWGRLWNKTKTVLGLAFGFGIDDNILDAYCFIARTYREGDRIFLLGFSRGSYTANAVAGMLFLIGLLEIGQLNLARYALVAYKRASFNNRLQFAWDFRNIIRSRRVPVHFLGAWDTVASVIVPGVRNFGLPAQVFLPYTRKNPGVEIYRGAFAIDERRRFFRALTWRPDQEFKPDPFVEKGKPQDQKSVWFAGAHTDIGGGLAETVSQPAKFALRWMILEAQAHGLRIDARRYDRMVLGHNPPDTKHPYVGPDARAPLYNSLTLPWWIVEVLPKNLKWKRYPAKSNSWGYYLPLGELRFVDDGSTLHWSVIERQQLTGYRPKNFPKSYAVAPDLPDPSGTP